MRSSGKTKPLVTVAIPIAATAAVDSIAVVVVVAATAAPYSMYSVPSIWPYTYTYTCVYAIAR